MIDLFNAIYDYYTTTPLASSLENLYNTEAPEDVEFPYGVFTLLSDVSDWTFTEEMENCLIQFNLFSKTVDTEEICTLFDLLITAFDFVDLDIDNYVCISATRENSILTRPEKVWQYNITYRFLLGKE